MRLLSHVPFGLDRLRQPHKLGWIYAVAHAEFLYLYPFGKKGVEELTEGAAGIDFVSTSAVGLCGGYHSEPSVGYL